MSSLVGQPEGTTGRTPFEEELHLVRDKPRRKVRRRRDQLLRDAAGREMTWIEKQRLRALTCVLREKEQTT
jgi:hypothetical protein